MKKLIILVLLASSLLGDDCIFWMKKTFEEITLMHLLVADKEYSQVGEVYSRFLESSRYTIATCESDDVRNSMFSLRKDALELLNKK